MSQAETPTTFGLRRPLTERNRSTVPQSSAKKRSKPTPLAAKINYSRGQDNAVEDALFKRPTVRKLGSVLKETASASRATLSSLSLLQREQPSTTSVQIGQIIQQQQQVQPRTALTTTLSSSINSTQEQKVLSKTPPRKSLDFMELRDGKRLDTTPGKHRGEKSPGLKHRPVPARVTPLDTYAFLSQADVPPSPISSSTMRTRPVVSVASPKRNQVSAISPQMMDEDRLTMSPIRRSRRLINQQEQMAQVIEPVLRRQHMRSPFQSSRRPSGLDSNTSSTSLFQEQLEDMNDENDYPTGDTDYMDSPFPRRTSLDLDERRVIRRMARMATDYGFEWDQVAVTCLALLKFILSPFRWIRRWTIRLWNPLTNVIGAVTGVIEAFGLLGRLAVFLLMAVIGIYISQHFFLQPSSLESKDLVGRLYQLEATVANLTGLLHSQVADPHRWMGASNKKFQEMEAKVQEVLQRLDKENQAADFRKTTEEWKDSQLKIQDIGLKLEQLRRDLSTMNAKIHPKQENVVDYDRLAEGLLNNVQQGRLEKLQTFLNQRPDVDKQEWVNFLRVELEKIKNDLSESSAAIQNKDTKNKKVIEDQTIQATVDRALEKFAADILAIPDYALRSAGARIMRYPGLTSRIFIDEYGKRNLKHISERSGIVGWIQSLLLPHPALPVPPPMANPPEAVIDGSNRAGRCWSFAGSSGVLTILLARRIRPTNVSIEHVSRSVWPDSRCAPKDIEFWATSLKQSDYDMLEASYRRTARDPSILKTVYENIYGVDPTDSSTGTPGSFVTDDNATPGSNSETNSNLLGKARLLARVQYDIEGKAIQTFAVREIQQTEPVDVLQVRVLSNWGHRDFTCIYRIRAHGIEESVPSKAGM